jgi:hypothetical protein
MKRGLSYQAGTWFTQRFGSTRARSAKPAEEKLDRQMIIRSTLGNLLMLIGMVLLLYVGGIYVQADYERYAARGDTDIPAPAAVSAPAQEEPAPFVAPVLSIGDSAEGQVVSAVPDSAQLANTPSVTRVAIPSIGVDSKVIEVGWDVEQQNGQQVAIWQVAKYAVGQHRGSANPGEAATLCWPAMSAGMARSSRISFMSSPATRSPCTAKASSTSTPCKTACSSLKKASRPISTPPTRS